MNWSRLAAFAVPMILVACTSGEMKTIAQLRNRKIEIKEERLEGGLQKAMASYERFLKESPDSSLTPEAMRRLADLKIENEYGILGGGENPAGRQTEAAPAAAAAKRTESAPAGKTQAGSGQDAPAVSDPGESRAEFEERTTRSRQPDEIAGADRPPGGTDDLLRPEALEAIKLYQRLLDEYPLYERNDQVLYQMSRAYEELGRVEEAMDVMNRLVNDFPDSRYVDEVQFRRAEYFFAHRRYLDAEEAYADIVDIGVGSSFYQLALYKLGWTFYKQELYERALDKFIALLDYQVSVGYDFSQTENEPRRKRLEDTFRVISLSFSYLGGADAVVDYFSRNGKRSYEDRVYRHLGEYYFEKRRYSDATATYNAFVNRNPFHEMAPHFYMRVIEINKAGGFPSLVIEAKKKFATRYGLQAEYWQHFEPEDYPEVLGYLKTNLTDLANHYHALYQDERKEKEKEANFAEALHWYREFLASFPMDAESPEINYQMANLLLENRSFGNAAVEFEKTAYAYPRHEKASKAGYAAIYAYREHLETLPEQDRNPVRREVVRSSLKFADTFPEHDKAAIVLGAAADDLYAMEDFAQALVAARKLIKVFPGAEVDVRRAAWLVVAHSTYELLRYGEAEAAYGEVLALLPEGDPKRDSLVDNLAASIYKQGEQANARGDYRAAADHFLRVARKTPTSKIRPTAEYDASAALIKLEDWKKATSVLLGFRQAFAGHELQPEVTKKLAYVYRESGKPAQAAAEYERIERESDDDEIRREALLTAAQLHEEAGNSARVLAVYRRYVDYFPRPVELNLETRGKMAEILKRQKDRESYLDQLRKIVAIEAAAGEARTARTRRLAAQAALVLAELSYDRFVEIRLVEPFKVNLRKKRERMKAARDRFGKLLDYQVGEVTAAATFYLAEIYAHFSKALMESERPEGLSPLEREQYELAIEEQAYPFEEQAIDIHEKNLELISRGIYNAWVDKSLEKLARFVPARYDKPEKNSGIVTSLSTYVYELDKPASGVAPVGKAKASKATSASAPEGNPEPGGASGKVEASVQTEQTEQVVPKANRIETEGPLSNREEVKGAEPGPVSARVQEGESAATTDPAPVEKEVRTFENVESGSGNLMDAAGQ